MAEIFEESNGEVKFPNARLSKTNFLSSVRDFAPDGVLLGIERVSKVFPSAQDPKKAQITVEAVVMQDMDTCRLFALDDGGEYIMVKDELTGNESRKMVLEPVSKDDLVSFPIFFPCGFPEKIDNEAELKFYPTSSAYPLFKLALQQAGELPEDMPDKPFKTIQEELKEVLEGFTFIGKCEEVKGKFNYMRLAVEPVEQE